MAKVKIENRPATAQHTSDIKTNGKYYVADQAGNGI